MDTIDLSQAGRLLVQKSGKGKKIKANELRNVQVDYISLVERGANMSPIKITKSAKGATGTNGLT